jgi:hypothetical protein
LHNLGLLLVCTGGLHLWLYTFKRQGTRFKFHPQWLGEKNARFLFGRQVPDNMFWSIVSGCTIWTAYESLVMWSYGNDLVPRVEWKTEPVYILVLLALPCFGKREFATPVSDEDYAFIHRILDNSWAFHGRVASRKQVQIEIPFPHHRE